MTPQPVPRGRARIHQAEVEERAAALNEPPWAHRLCDSLLSGAKKQWARRTIRQKGAIVMLLIFVSVTLMLIGFSFLVIAHKKSEELQSLESHFQKLSGFDLPCYSRSTQWCSSYQEESKSDCLKICQLNWDCLTAVYNGHDSSCKLYFGNTPFMMGLDPHHDDAGSIFIKNTALFHRLHREVDNLFYFVSEAPLTQDQAQGYCYDSYKYSHVAVLPYSRLEEGLLAARSVASHVSAELEEEVGLLLHIVAGGREMMGDTHASIARRVNSHLQFQGNKPRNAKLLPIVISAHGPVQPADFFTRYYILCQHDPFNYYGLAEFYSNLNSTIRTGQRRRRRALFLYDDF